MAQQGDQTILEEAQNLFVKGKRFMALDDYQQATDCLEQACQLFDAFYGVAKYPCADAYYEYGLALVALANQEAGSGTDKLMKRAGIEGDEEDEEGDDEEGEYDDEEEEEGGPADEDKEDVEEGKEATASGDQDANGAQVEETKGQKSGETDNAQNGDVPMESSSQETKTNGVGKKEEKPQPQASSSSAPEPTPGTSNGCEGGDKDSDDAENEEATTIEIAWEVLCLAKRLFMTDESLEGRHKLAECLQKIGEISIEWDNNDNAVSILEECLKIRSSILQPDDRLIALTYYHLGLAHSFKSDTQNANDSFQKAITVIEQRIASLNKELEKAKEGEDTVTIGSIQKEINELRELLPDMTMRLDDSKEDGTKSTEVIKRSREEFQMEDEEAMKLCSDKSKPVDDISHLVKRKAA